MPSPNASRSGTRFGEGMMAAFGGPRATAAGLRELRFGPFSVMDVRCDVPGYGRSAPIPDQDALLVALQLRANAAYEIREHGKRLDCRPVGPGMVNIYDLRGSVVSASAQPFHSLTFTLPVRPRADGDGGRRGLAASRAGSSGAPATTWRRTWRRTSRCQSWPPPARCPPRTSRAHDLLNDYGKETVLADIRIDERIPSR
jgi:hypothetical protein